MQISQRFSVYPCDDGTNIIYDEENEIIFARVISKNVASAVCKELNLNVIMTSDQCLTHQPAGEAPQTRGRRQAKAREV